MKNPSIAIMDEIAAELERQVKMAHGGDTAALDLRHSENDWIAIVLAYLGRASRGVFRNDRENQEFRPNMIKAATTIISALTAIQSKESDA